MRKYVTAVLLLLLATAAGAQQLVPTAKQHKQLAKQQAKARAIQNKVYQLQAEESFALGQLDQMGTTIIAANRWPLGTQFNGVQFTLPPPPAPKPPVTPEVKQ